MTRAKKLLILLAEESPEDFAPFLVLAPPDGKNPRAWDSEHVEVKNFDRKRRKKKAGTGAGGGDGSGADSSSGADTSNSFKLGTKRVQNHPGALQARRGRMRLLVLFAAARPHWCSASALLLLWRPVLLSRLCVTQQQRPRPSNPFTPY